LSAPDAGDGPAPLTLTGPAGALPGALLEAGARALARSASPRLDAELLLAHALGSTRAALRVLGELPVPAAARERYARLLAARAAGAPVAYLTGERGFWTLTLAITPAVLVPRPETELLVELALERLPPTAPATVLDLGAGSGAVGLAIASERPRAQVELVDTSAAALAVAEQNRRRLGLGNVRCLLGDWYEPVGTRRYDVIVANPPYLAPDDPHLATPELEHEPRAALVAGPTGLEALATVVRGAARHLAAGGWLLTEHGATQGAAVRALFAAAGLGAIATRRDLAGLERATIGRRAA
jgi:release factor glutamine methyltransferase